MGTINEYIEVLDAMPEAERRAAIADALEATKNEVWVPNPGPQTDAYFSQADVLLYGGEPGGGKLLNTNTFLPTPHGWTTMGEVRVGESVIDDQGRPCRVTFKSDVQTEKTFRLTFSDGSQIEAGANHQWITRTRVERLRALKQTDQWRERRRASRPSRARGNKSAAFVASINARNAATAVSHGLPLSNVRNTQQIHDTLRAEGGRLNHSVDMAAPFVLDEAHLVVDPYVLGVWLGDGSENAGQITGIDEEIFQRVGGSYSVTKLGDAQRRGTIGLQTDLKRIGVFGNKHIPAQYLRASHTQRLHLLHGLMDTDGYCDIRGQCEFTQVRRHLAEQFLELLATLGIKATMREGLAKLNGRITGPNYKIKFLTDLPAFSLPRKLLRQKRSGFRGTHDVRYIVRADEIPSVPMQCIQVDSPNHMYLCGRSMIPTHNTQLLLGLAFSCHQRSLVMRRQYGDLDRIIEDMLRLNGGREGFNGSPPPKLRRPDGRIINLGAAQRVGDEQHRMGQGVDALLIDEATHFAENQIRFLMGWVRTEDPDQRTRTVLATNPPLTAEGLWVNQMFAPWLDETYKNPAKPGELRWVVTDEEGKDRWVDGPDQVTVGSKKVRPKSRTYIPASVKDNPYYANTDYERELDAMPEPHRSILLGKFKTTFHDAPNQVIPTAWIRFAQERWSPRPPQGVPMCAIGVDCSGGGKDPMILAPRHDGWFAPLISVQGKDIPVDRIGSYSSGVIVSHRRDRALVVVDMGGGYGQSTYEHCKVNDIEVFSYKGSEHTDRRSKDRRLHFTNTRGAALWALREALDPDQPGGSPIALPNDAQLMADLAAPTFEPTTNGIKVESKEDVCARLGRSTDKGDAVMMAWWAGPKEVTNALEWAEQREMAKLRRPLGRLPRAIMGPRPPLTGAR